MWYLEITSTKIQMVLVASVQYWNFFFYQMEKGVIKVGYILRVELHVDTNEDELNLYFI